MSTGDTTLTITGNLTGDPEVRFTAVSREFAISEAPVGLNRRVGSCGRGYPRLAPVLAQDVVSWA
jgi:hypothetical protein